jgi:hypothetical protein
MTINNITLVKTKYDAFFKYTSYYNEEVVAKASELKTLFGEPTFKNGRNIEYYMLMVSNNSCRAITLYNNYNSTSKKRYTTFHIGGNGKEETITAKEFVESALKMLRRGVIRWRNIPNSLKCTRSTNKCCFCEYLLSINEKRGRVLCVSRKQAMLVEQNAILERTYRN